MTSLQNLEQASLQLDRCAKLCAQLASNARAGHSPTGEVLDSAIASLRGLRREIGPPVKPAGSARVRILRYFEANEGKIVFADEIAEVAHIHAWARRVRELRADGHPIEHLGGDKYIMHRHR